MKNIITTLLIIFALSANGQSVKRIVNKMEKDDFEKGRELALKVLEDNPDDAGANFCMAWMTFDKDEYFKAYKYMLNFKKNLPNIDPGDKEVLMEYMKAEMTRMRKKSFDERIDKLYNDMESKAINYVREQLDPELASQYIEMFPESPFLKNTIHIRNHYAFLKAQKAGTVEALLKFKKEYPDAAQQNKAQELIHELKFQQAKEQKSLNALNEFIEQYPLAKQHTEAYLLRDKLAFEKAKNKNSLEAIERFISEYPEALQLGDAKKIRQKLVFEKAKEINTIEAYTNFVKEYPFGKYYVDIFNLKSKALGNRIAQSSQIKNTQIARAFDYDQTPDFFAASSIDDNENITIAGTIKLDTAPNNDVWLLQLDKTGKMQWNKQFGSPANDKINELFQKEDGSFLGIGIYGETDTTNGQGWMLSVANDGKKQWMKLLTNLHPVTSCQDENDILVGGSTTDSIPNMRLIRFDSESDKKWHRKYSTHGTINSIKPHAEKGHVFCGKNWVCHIDDDGYIQYDEMLDSNLVLLDVVEKDGVIYGAGINNEFNLFLWDSQNKNVTQTDQQVKQIQYLPNTDILVLLTNGNLMQLSNSGGYVKDIGKKIANFTMQGNKLFFTSKESILKSNIVYVKL